MVKKIFRITPETTRAGLYSITAFRIFAGLTMAFSHGIKKLPPTDKFIEGVAKLGFPAPEFFAWSAGLAEFAGGLLLALGLATRVSGTFMAFTMATAAFGAHASDAFNVKELALIYLVLALLFAVRGGSQYSLDGVFVKHDHDVIR